MNCRFILGIALALGLIQAAQPKTWYVAPPPAGADSGHDGTNGWNQALATISNAVAKASGGDTVLVTNGDYVLSANLTINKALDLRSVNGPSITVIDGNDRYRCVEFNNTTVGSSTNTRIQGFTIRHGQAASGAAGIYINGRGATIHDCMIVSNSMTSTVYAVATASTTHEQTLLSDTLIAYNKNAVYLRYLSNVGLRDCTIASNVGYAIRVYDIEPTNRWFERCTVTYNNSGSSLGSVSLDGPTIFTNCLFTYNTSLRGGGIYLAAGTSMFWNSTITSNRSTAEGGGIYVITSADFLQCRIAGNTSASGGGGVHIIGADVTLSNCSILDNLGGQGGGVYDSQSTRLYNCLIAGNSSGTNATHGGGGIYFSSANKTSQYWNCTITSNAALSATGAGGGLWVGGEVRLINTILYGNSAETSSSNWFRNSGTLYATNCCVAPAAGTGFAGENNLDADPLFADQAGANFRLGPGSPCINAGLNQVWMSQTTDLDGRPRLDRLNRIVDLGCFEYIFPGTFFSVK